MVVEILENDHFRLAADSKCFFFAIKGQLYVNPVTHGM